MLRKLVQTILRWSSNWFDGYKRHIATDLDTDLVLACAVTPANRPEEEAAPILKTDLWKLDPRDWLGLLLNLCSECIGAVRVAW